MSDFQGPLNEYPWIVVDCFVSRNLSAKAFFLSHCHKDHMKGLDGASFAKTLRVRFSNGVRLYCSETTKNLIKCDYGLCHLDEYTIGIPVNEPTTISVTEENKLAESDEKVIVTLLPAGHCVGSVMFLFEGTAGNVLYTGDFRLSPDEVEKMPGLQSSLGTKKIKSVYLDTTFCTPSVKSLPSREETADAVKRVVKSWIRKGENYLVQLICSARYGYEFILKELAEYFEIKIHISPGLYQLYSCLPNMIQHFTLDQKASQIHACTRKKYQKRSTGTHCGLAAFDGKKIHVLRIKPSTMWFVMRDIYPRNLTRNVGGIYRVLHSMHASYSEIRHLVGFLCPKYIFPTVVPALSSDILEAYKCLKHLQNDDPASQETKTSSVPESAPSDHKYSVKTVPAQKITSGTQVKVEIKRDLHIGKFLSSSPPVKRRRKGPPDTTTEHPLPTRIKPDTSSEMSCNARANGHSSTLSQLKSVFRSKWSSGESELGRLFGSLSPPVRRKRKKYIVHDKQR